MHAATDMQGPQCGQDVDAHHLPGGHGGVSLQVLAAGDVLRQAVVAQLAGQVDVVLVLGPILRGKLM
jgi:hypothetical protein